MSSPDRQIVLKPDSMFYHLCCCDNRLTKKKGQILPCTSILHLPDQLLLEIFDCLRLEDEYEWNHTRRWYKLLHACRKWRYIMLESASRLNYISSATSKPQHQRCSSTLHLCPSSSTSIPYTSTLIPPTMLFMHFSTPAVWFPFPSTPGRSIVGSCSRHRTKPFPRWRPSLSWWPCPSAQIARPFISLRNLYPLVSIPSNLKMSTFLRCPHYSPVPPQASSLSALRKLKPVATSLLMNW